MNNKQKEYVFVMLMMAMTIVVFFIGMAAGKYYFEIECEKAEICPIKIQNNTVNTRTVIQKEPVYLEKIVYNNNSRCSKDCVSVMMDEYNKFHVHWICP